jgi:hypothetical protein
VVVKGDSAVVALIQMSMSGSVLRSRVSDQHFAGEVELD